MYVHKIVKSQFDRINYDHSVDPSYRVYNLRRYVWNILK